MTSNLLAALKSNQAKSALSSASPLIDAAKTGLLEGVERWLDEPKAKPDQRDPDGQTALMHASSQGYLDIVKYVLHKGARINAKDDIGETALMKACKEGQIHVVQYFVDYIIATHKKKAVSDFLPSNASGSKTRQSSTDRQSSKLARSLDQAERRRLLDAKDDEGITSLMKAAEQGELEIVDYLLQQGATLDIQDDEGWTCLMWACLAGQLEVVELLIQEWGMAAEYATDKSETPLMKAAANGHWECCKFLLDEGAKVNHHDVNYQTALMWASAQGHVETIEGLLTHDAKIDVTTKNGENALFFACMFGKIDAAKILLAKGCNVVEKNKEGQSAIFAAVRCGHRELVEILIGHGASVESITQRGQTPLAWAAMFQQYECVKLLIAKKSDLYKQDENGQNPLDHAESTLNSHIVEELREAMRENPKKEED